MIRIKLYKNQDKIYKFTVKGHADYAPRGYDIVCSAVTTSVMQTVLYLEKYDMLGKNIVKDGNVEIGIKKNNANQVLESMEMMLKEIASEYSKYVKIEIKG